MRRLLSILTCLAWSLTLIASPTENKDAAEAALAEIDQQISHARQKGDTRNECLARWQKIVTLKNFSLTAEQAKEAEVQMDWFRKNDQWDYYYRSWQLKANALSALGNLQQALQETQRMLDDAKQRKNKLGYAMAYKQIGIIYLNMKQTEPAIEALRHYADLMKDEKDDYVSLSNIYYRMAKAYDYDGNFDKELQVTNEWLDFLHKKVGKKELQDIRECYNACYLARAAAFIGMKRLKDAETALDTAERHSRRTHSALSMHHFYKMQARLNLAKGDAPQALLYTDSVRMTTNEKDDHTDDVRGQALIMLGRGEEAALIYQRLYYEKDSVFGRETRLHLDELNTLFQLDELKTEQQRSRIKYMFISTFSVVVMLLLLGFYGWRSAIRQKKANELLRIANERAKVSSKMKTEFIRNISHEIRTPLNIVSGFTQIMTAPGTRLSEDEKADIQKRVTENTDRITKLVDRMLEMSDVSSEAVIERMDRITLRELVAQAVEHSRITLHTRPDNPNSSVVFERPELIPEIPVLTHKRFAIRAAAQLLENAVKFTKKGTVRLKVEYTDSDLRFVVEDTGIGIPPEQTDHIFDEFVQLDTFADGTGIGLTVARSISRRMGGDLWLDKKYSDGARFILELPRT